MDRACTRIFLPGWAASTALYGRGLPEGWKGLDPPVFRTTGGELDAYRDWVVDLVERESPVVLGGHSMGGALAVFAAAARPDLVAGLVLVSPAGLPLQKPFRSSLATFFSQVARRRYPARELAADVIEVVRAPGAALRLARAVHDLDLSAELRTVCAAGIPATVIGCPSDTLVTTAHCRALAGLLGATYRTVDMADGHIWMLRGWRRLASELSAPSI